jgi:hypothetical protein
VDRSQLSSSPSASTTPVSTSTGIPSENTCSDSTVPRWVSINQKVVGTIRDWLAVRVDQEALDLICQLVESVASPSSVGPTCSLVDVVDRVLIEREARTERTIQRAFHALDRDRQGNRV